MKLLLKIALVRAGFRFLDQTKSVGHLRAQEIVHQVRPFDLHIVQQTELPVLLDVRPRQERGRSRRKKPGREKGKNEST